MPPLIFSSNATVNTTSAVTMPITFTGGWVNASAIAYSTTTITATADWFIPASWYRVNILSEETRRRMREEERQANLQARRANAQRDEEAARARDKARALLFRCLTPDQYRSLTERQYFDMNVGGKTYRIRQGTHGNVRLIQGGQETMLYCAQPPNVPTEDAMLAQKLMLETDEAAFLRVANARVLRAA